MQLKDAQPFKEHVYMKNDARKPFADDKKQFAMHKDYAPERKVTYP